MSYPVVNGLVKYHLKSDSQDLAAVKHFNEVVLVKLQRRFPFDCENVAILAAAIDPRYQHLKFFNTEQEEAVYTVLHDRVEILYQLHNTVQWEVSEPSQP